MTEEQASKIVDAIVQVAQLEADRASMTVRVQARKKLVALLIADTDDGQ